MLNRIVAAGAFVAASLLAGPASADDAEACRTAWGDAGIAACSRQIQSGQVTGHDLAMAYLARADLETGWSHDYDHAIADSSEAMQLEPGNADALRSRASAYFGKKDYDHAIPDYTELIRLNPNDGFAFFNRGLARQRHGDVAGGNDDIAKAKLLQPDLVTKTEDNAAPAPPAPAAPTPY